MDIVVSVCFQGALRVQCAYFHISEWQLSVCMSNVCVCVCGCVCNVQSPPFTHLVASGHDGHHRELLHLHLGDAHGGQQADLRGAHVGALGQHTLPALDVMTTEPGGGEGAVE